MTSRHTHAVRFVEVFSVLLPGDGRSRSAFDRNADLQRLSRANANLARAQRVQVQLRETTKNQSSPTGFSLILKIKPWAPA